MKFYVLPVGKCEDDKGRVFTPGKDEGVRIVAPNWVGLVQAFGLNLLIDTGMHPIHIERPDATFAGTIYENNIHPIMDEEDTTLQQLKNLGVEPEDIHFVINTHLHFDHCGCNAYFPRATFIVQKEHYQYALENPEAFPHKYFEIAGLNYDLIDGEMTLFPGFDLLRCPGHVPGMMGIVLRLEKAGTIVIASDAISIKEMLEEDRWEAFWNPTLARSSGRRLAAIADAEAGMIFYGHDPEWWKTVRIAPNYYE
jgi:N-acyl homoserine lactone hydrolase